jgi:hypothetical protein
MCLLLLAAAAAPAPLVAAQDWPQPTQGPHDPIVNPGGVEYLQKMEAAWGAIDAKRGQYPWLGHSIGSVKRTNSETLGFKQEFQGGTVYWMEASGAHEVHGAIRALYAEYDGEAVFGLPQTDELSTVVAGVEIRYSNFEHHSINYTAARGAYIDPSVNPVWKNNQTGYYLTVSGFGFGRNENVTLCVREPDSLEVCHFLGGPVATDAYGGFEDAAFTTYRWPVESNGDWATLEVRGTQSNIVGRASVPPMY